MNIYKIASLADVSTTTVSKVINGKEGVSKKTRDKILKIIEDSCYTPRISNNTADVIGVVYRLDGIGFSTSSYLMKTIASITDTLCEYGFFTTLIPYDFLPKGKADLQVFCKRRKISGYICLNLRVNSQQVYSLAEVSPVVTINCKFEGDKIASVRSNSKEGAYNAVSQLIAYGHTDIVAFMPDLLIPDHFDRLEGYKQALRDNNIPFKQEYVVDYSHSLQDLPLMIERLFVGVNSPPTAAFICDDYEVMRIKSIFDRFNLRVPEDISIIGFDDYDYSAYFTPPLTTVRQPLELLGAEAAKCICQMIGNPGKAVQDVILDTQLILRKSAKSIK